VGALASDERTTFDLALGIARLLNGNFQVRPPARIVSLPESSIQRIWRQSGPRRNRTRFGA